MPPPPPLESILLLLRFALSHPAVVVVLVRVVAVGILVKGPEALSVAPLARLGLLHAQRLQVCGGHGLRHARQPLVYRELEDVVAVAALVGAVPMKFPGVAVVASLELGKLLLVCH